MTKETFTLRSIGRVSARHGRFRLHIDEAYRPALEGLDGFSHVDVLFWCDQLDADEPRAMVQCDRPYRKGPERLGVFATRSPARPNPIALTPVPILAVDHNAGTIDIPFIDAENNSPILDLKPYHPATDRIREVTVPEWCSHWPEWYEDSATFDWGAEFENAQ